MACSGGYCCLESEMCKGCGIEELAMLRKSADSLLAIGVKPEFSHSAFAHLEFAGSRARLACLKSAPSAAAVLKLASGCKSLALIAGKGTANGMDYIESALKPKPGELAKIRVMHKNGKIKFMNGSEGEIAGFGRAAKKA